MIPLRRIAPKGHIAAKVGRHGSSASDTKAVQPPSSKKITTDMIGPPDPVSNLRRIVFKQPVNETELEKRYRKLRMEVQEWNQKFWAQHNSRFFQEREEYLKKNLPEGKQNLTADEMSVFYKSFLDKNWKTHIAYNIEWYKKNVTLLILSIQGMLIDLTHPNKVLFYQRDESTILPTSSYKTLKTSLQMESKQRDKHEDTRTRNVMISEAFLRFFVDILGDFWRFFEVREPAEGEMGRNGVVFDKDAFIRSTSSKQNQYFLEWFSETAMFNHFIQNMAATHPLSPNPGQLMDTPLPNFYELFQQRLSSRNQSEQVSRLPDSKSNYKNAVNKKVKMLKTKLRELVA